MVAGTTPVKMEGRAPKGLAVPYLAPALPVTMETSVNIVSEIHKQKPPFDTCKVANIICCLFGLTYVE